MKRTHALLLVAIAACSATTDETTAAVGEVACSDPFQVANLDADGNTRAPAELQCDEGEILVGIFYRERVSDGMDGPGLVCRRPDGSTHRVVVDADLADNTQPDVDSACPTGERLIGIAYKDVEGTSIHTQDAADGVASICESGPGPEPSDLTSNALPYQKHVCPGGSVAVGVAYADRDAETNSDLVDHLTLICREVCTTCEPEDSAPIDNLDAEGNTRAPVALQCADDEILVGTLYRERLYDAIDGPGLLCRRPDGALRRVILEPDLGPNTNPDIDSLCPAGQRLVGLGYKDVPGDWVHTLDTTDGVVAICEGGRGPEPADLASNPRAYLEVTCPANSDAVGLVYGDRDAAVNSDLTDFITVLCRDTCAP